MVKSGVSNRDICQFVTVAKITKPLQTLTCHDVTVGSARFRGCRGGKKTAAARRRRENKNSRLSDLFRSFPNLSRPLIFYDTPKVALLEDRAHWRRPSPINNDSHQFALIRSKSNRKHIKVVRRQPACHSSGRRREHPSKAELARAVALREGGSAPARRWKEPSEAIREIRFFGPQQPCW